MEMIKLNEAKELDGGSIDPRHEVISVCASCGYDLDENELASDTCSDCGAALNLAQHVRIYATSIPAAEGRTLG